MAGRLQRLWYGDQPALTAAAPVRRRALTSAAYQVRPGTPIQPRYELWQDEAWSYWQELGEVYYGVRWLSEMLSRIRLVAAEVPDAPGDEPTLYEGGGTPTDLLERFAGGMGGQSEILRRLTVQLSVPGEGWLVGEPDTDQTGTGDRWSVRSADEIRQAKRSPGRRGVEGNVVNLPRRGGSALARLAGNGRDYGIEVVDETMPPGGQQRWRTLADDALVNRIWNPHDRRYREADSPVRHALSTARRLQLANRYIQAQFLSRLASAGVFVLPDDIDFPVREEFEGQPDAVIREFLAIAEEAIQTPGSAAALVPILMQLPPDTIEKIKFVDFTTAFDQKVLEKREGAVRELASIMDVPSEVLTGMGDVNHWCTLDSVEILTIGGWKTHDQLTPGEQVLTLNHETGLSEWQPLLTVNTFEVADEPMVKLTGRRHSSVTTLNHRWPTFTGPPTRRKRAWDTSGDLWLKATTAGQDKQRQDYVILAAPCADLPTEPKYSDALVELVAWYFTEGDYGVRPGRRTPQVAISQSHEINPDNVALIRRALTILYGPESNRLDKGGRYSTPESVARRAKARDLYAKGWTGRRIATELGVSTAMVNKYLTTDAKLRDAVPRWRVTTTSDGRLTRFILNAAAAEPILEHAPGRIVTLSFVRQLTGAQLELFIDTAIRGDGYYMSGVTPVFSQKNPRMCDAFELALILSGRSLTRRQHTGIGRSKDGPRVKVQEVVTGSRSTTFAPRGRSFEEIRHTGTIWCPTTPNGTWLARHEGTVFFTGNSAWQLEESGIKVHIAPRMETIVHAFTDGWYRPMLKAAGEDPARFLIWYDPSEIVVRPDKSEKALVLYDRGEADGAALRRESGMDEGDKPEGDELKEWALKQLVLGKGGEALVPVAYKELTGEELEVPTPAAPAVPGRTPGEPTPNEGGEEDGEEDGGDVNERRTEPGTQTEPPPAPNEGARPAAASIAITGPNGWPLERRADGWYVKNVTYWERLPQGQQQVVEGRWREIAMAMNGKAEDATLGS